MGLCPSPYNVIQGLFVAKQFVLDDPIDSTNTLQWSSILENLPCSTTYNVSEPKLKICHLGGMTASEMAQYVDILRLIAATKELAWQVEAKFRKVCVG